MSGSVPKMTANCARCGWKTWATMRSSLRSALPPKSRWQRRPMTRRIRRSPTCSCARTGTRRTGPSICAASPGWRTISPCMQPPSWRIARRISCLSSPAPIAAAGWGVTAARRVCMATAATPCCTTTTACPNCPALPSILDWIRWRCCVCGCAFRPGCRRVWYLPWPLRVIRRRWSSWWTATARKAM